MRSIILEHMMPIVNIAKDNMLTNINKNVVMENARSDMSVIYTRMSEMEKIQNSHDNVKNLFVDFEKRVIDMLLKA